MNNSSVCTYKTGDIVRNKRKYSTFEEAFTASKKINQDPKVIHKFQPYKCTTCYYFHVGRTKKLLEHKVNIFDPEAPKRAKEELKLKEAERQKLIRLTKIKEEEEVSDIFLKAMQYGYR